MRVNFCSPAADFGGAEVHMLCLIEASRARARQVDVTIQDLPGLEPLVSAVERLGATLRPAAVAWDWTAPSQDNVRRQGQAFEQVLDQAPPDLVVVSLPWPNYGLGALRACMARDVPTIAVFHLAAADHALERDEIEGMRDVHAAGQLWVAVSPGVQSAVAAMVGVPKQRIPVISNGVSIPCAPSQPEIVGLRARIRRELGFEEDARLVLTVARLDPQKGHFDLLAALPRILDAIPQARFAWLGEGPVRVELESAARAINAKGKVLAITGHVDNVDPFYWACDAFVLPSYLEGHSLALLEAAAHGCAIVTTSIQQDRLLRPQSNVLLHRPGDLVDLAEHVVRILGDGGFASRIGAGARAWASAHSITGMIENYERLVQAHCQRWSRLVGAAEAAAVSYPRN